MKKVSFGALIRKPRKAALRLAPALAISQPLWLLPEPYRHEPLPLARCYNDLSMNRYSRQISFDPIGDKGQQRIRHSCVAVLGCGALGTASAEMLARGGIGGLILIDRDFVEESNLQRQSLFSEEDARQGLPKAVAARQALQKLNSEVEVTAWVRDLDGANIASSTEGCRILIDGTDNFETRFLINDFAVNRQIPWIYGAALGSFGVALAIDPKAGSACLQCLMEELPLAGSVETCETVGILATAIHAVASFQVAEALRFLSGTGFTGRILQADTWTGSWRTVPLSAQADPDCRCCGLRRFRYLELLPAQSQARLCGRNAVQLRPSRPGQVDLEGLARRLRHSVRVSCNPYLLRIGAEDCDIALFRDGRSIVRGTEDPARARALYSRYVGT